MCTCTHLYCVFEPYKLVVVERIAAQLELELTWNYLGREAINVTSLTMNVLLFVLLGHINGLHSFVLAKPGLCLATVQKIHTTKTGLWNATPIQHQ